MRRSCLNCVRKHLGQASVLLGEVGLGYPEHFWLAIGHMAEAEAESLYEYPELANVIREHRISIIDDHGHFIDFIELIEMASSYLGEDN